MKSINHLIIITLISLLIQSCNSQLKDYKLPGKYVLSYYGMHPRDYYSIDVPHPQDVGKKYGGATIIIPPFIDKMNFNDAYIWGHMTYNKDLEFTVGKIPSGYFLIDVEKELVKLGLNEEELTKLYPKWETIKLEKPSEYF